MSFRITGLPAEAFADLRGLDDGALAARGVRRVIADAFPGYPCRITLEDAQPGESLLLLNWIHLDGDTPYRGNGPIFIRESALQTFDAVGVVPLQQSRRTLSVRAYDAAGFMRHGLVVQGEGLEAKIGELFADADVAFLHLHNAGRGCYAARVDRA
jgi:hypothetical protein